ncbi:MAG: NAD(P)H-dependent oxidoreductase subunit E [Candidatus Hydrothermae bacterium]|nr:NAD(P)H-dependent oxidoreductase subunit E [Candidatus Hydrothermae bacterium]
MKHATASVDMKAFEERIRSIQKTFPGGRTAILPSLLAAQETFGYVTPESLNVMERVLNIPQGILKEVGSFYHFIDFEFKGRHRVYVCTNLSCLLNGAQKLVEALREELGVEEDKVTPDGAVSYRTVECIGLCDRAPAALVDGEQLGPLTPETLVERVRALRKDKESA